MESVPMGGMLGKRAAVVLLGLTLLAVTAGLLVALDALMMHALVVSVTLAP